MVFMFLMSVNANERRLPLPFCVLFLQRDLSDSVPIDAHDGMLGITHYDVAARIKSVHQVRHFCNYRL